MSHMTFAQDGCPHHVIHASCAVFVLTSLRLSTLHSSPSLIFLFILLIFIFISHVGWLGEKFPVRFREWGVMHFGRQQSSHRWAGCKIIEKSWKHEHTKSTNTPFHWCDWALGVFISSGFLVLLPYVNKSKKTSAFVETSHSAFSFFPTLGVFDILANVKNYQETVLKVWHGVQILVEAASGSTSDRVACETTIGRDSFFKNNGVHILLPASTHGGAKEIGNSGSLLCFSDAERQIYLHTLDITETLTHDWMRQIDTPHKRCVWARPLLIVLRFLPIKFRTIFGEDVTCVQGLGHSKVGQKFAEHSFSLRRNEYLTWDKREESCLILIFTSQAVVSLSVCVCVCVCLCVCRFVFCVHGVRVLLLLLLWWWWWWWWCVCLVCWVLICGSLCVQSCVVLCARCVCGRVHGVCCVRVARVRCVGVVNVVHFQENPTLSPNKACSCSQGFSPLLPWHDCFFDVFVIHSHHNKVRRSFRAENFAPLSLLMFAPCWPPFWTVDLHHNKWESAISRLTLCSSFAWPIDLTSRLLSLFASGVLERDAQAQYARVAAIIQKWQCRRLRRRARKQTITNKGHTREQKNKNIEKKKEKKKHIFRKWRRKEQSNRRNITGKKNKNREKTK